MKFITLNENNINKEHLCCSLSAKDVDLKRAWLKDRLDEGLVFRKANVRGKVFIEYLPAESAWAPIEAPQYMFINCLWVSGQFKNKGLSRQLMEDCLLDSREKNKHGVVILSSKKKRPYLADAKFLAHMGFKCVDTIHPYFELWVHKFDDAPNPKFKRGLQAEDGLVLYYTNQCPYTKQYVSQLAEACPKLKVINITSKEQAQVAPCPYTTFSLFYNGKFLTHEVLTKAKFLLLVEDLGI